MATNDERVAETRRAALHAEDVRLGRGDRIHLEVVVRISVDRAKADAYNASLFDGDEHDPVVGDGEALMRDIVRDSGVGELVESLRRDQEWGDAEVEATLNGEPLDL
jgi:hypothetical protein